MSPGLLWTPGLPYVRDVSYVEGPGTSPDRDELDDAEPVAALSRQPALQLDDPVLILEHRAAEGEGDEDPAPLKAPGYLVIL